ncbi:MATE family efflux transporter [Bradyrhizobium sp. 24]|uniref:MATE family efflux transporter n=1 Tax=unclassified Bradyrhizobium TaxID=2631580 RepID=UPI001FFB2604|nr:MULTISPECIES: MATE family efflux transporter [unclassified Bradyrhizobium]MCK1296677.1 MATE family efflux transporter [Bradyrhizobium sp. 37]MCK1377488.1 MATE family efflux transporter [Bradyrhizobium sp. 24]MCK1770435.1 MATE family efflux transporter [Bradyrhizobium sp. 134]
MVKITETKSGSHSWHRRTGRTACHHLAVELNETAKLALPMALTQVAQIAMMTTDLVFIGRTGVESIAAVALASRVYLVSFAFGAGLLAPIATLAAQAFGAHKPAMIRRSLRMGLWMALLISLPIIAFALRGEQILLALGQEPNAARLAQQYLFGLAWGVAPALGFLAIRSFMGSVNRPGPALWITLAAIPAKVLLVYLLINGRLGLPQSELFGMGLATTLVNCGTFSAGLWVATMCRTFRHYRVLAHLWRFDWPLIRQLIVIGTPISIAALVAYGLFSAAAILAGQISTSALAAHQIALQVASPLFMISFGISMAATVRVSHAVGRNDGPGIKRAGLVAMLLGVVITAMVTLAVIAARFELVELFLRESGVDADPTIGLAAELLLVGASLFISEAARSAAAGGLRGLKDTRVPLLLAGIVYWPMGFSLSYVLSFWVGLGAIGIWIGLSVGTIVYAGLLVRRFQLLANRLALGSRELRA